MGSANADEAPEHDVTVKSFELAKTLVTNKQYGACVAAGACSPAHVSDGACIVYFAKAGGWGRGIELPASFRGGDHPVVCVDRDQAAAFSAWAGGRLPSESEWEYAARSAGRPQAYPWGDADATCALTVISGCGEGTAPVCSKAAGNTRQGLCDMAGEAWEFVADSYHRGYDGAPSDGSSWVDGDPRGVIRGGGWSLGARFARAASRSFYDQGSAYGNLGFRPAR